MTSFYQLFKKIFDLLIFRERGREGEREGETSVRRVVESHTVPQPSELLTFRFAGQSTEPHQPGPSYEF